MTDWQPIETAPEPVDLERVHPKTKKVYTIKSPVRILCARNEQVLPSRLLENGRFEGFSKNFPPTHWMPFPEPPESDK